MSTDTRIHTSTGTDIRISTRSMKAAGTQLELAMATATATEVAAAPKCGSASLSHRLVAQKTERSVMLLNFKLREVEELEDPPTNTRRGTSWTGRLEPSLSRSFPSLENGSCVAS